MSQFAKEKLIKDILIVMRQDKYDIRQFNLKQLTTFIKEVGDTQPEDLSVFKNYVDAAIV